MPPALDQTLATTRSIQPSEGEAVVVHKETVVQAFTPEQELHHLVARGDFELIAKLPVFQNRSPESQVQILSEAIDHRISQINKSVNTFINSSSGWAAAMGMLARVDQLRRLKDEMLRQFYEQQGQQQIADRTGVKIDFY